MSDKATIETKTGYLLEVFDIENGGANHLLVRGPVGPATIIAEASSSSDLLVIEAVANLIDECNQLRIQVNQLLQQR